MRRHALDSFVNRIPFHRFRVYLLQRISRFIFGLEQAEALICKMDLKARSLKPNVKAVLLAKLRECKSDLNNLKSEVKRLASDNINQAARDDLLESRMIDASLRTIRG
ncbi:unnamed protein product [Lactuca virosa]|uniref:Vesicle transport v-SNARE N-terminal domain-containing protein n=1 Tax=Lactuca virosa TaxID=75947 RepID=A0AAU9P335_9ASTR|nr:unnamed protein product [Lactuca virosa]